MLEMFLDTEVDDLRCVMDTVKKLPFVNDGSLYLMGESMGGMEMRISDDFDKAAASLDPVAVQEGFDKPVLINPIQCGLGICCGCDR